MMIYLVNVFSILIWWGIYRKFENKDNIKRNILMCICLQFIIIQSLRDFSVGSDTQKYINYYSFMINSDISLKDTLFNSPFVFEKGYMILMFLCKEIGLNTRCFIILIAIIINVLFFRYIYYESKNIFISTWIFICVEFFALSFTMFRQMIAIGIILNATLYITKNDGKLRYISLVLLGGMFHKTVFLFLPIYWIVNYKGSGKRCSNFRNIFMKYKDFMIKYEPIIVLLILVLLRLILPNVIIFLQRLIYSDYGNIIPDIPFKTGQVLFVLMYIIYVITVIIESKYDLRGKEIKFYKLCLFIAMFFQIFSNVFIQLSRLSLNFYVIVIVLIPYLLYSMDCSKYKRYIIITTLLIFFAQYILFSFDIYNLIPYKLFF